MFINQQMKLQTDLHVVTECGCDAVDQNTDDTYLKDLYGSEKMILILFNPFNPCHPCSDFQKRFQLLERFHAALLLAHFNTCANGHVFTTCSAVIHARRATPTPRRMLGRLSGVWASV